jgi:hypothetical protein
LSRLAVIAVACLLALTPLIPLAAISTHAMRRATDLWLRGLLLGGCVWLAWAEPIFVPLGLWALVRWPASHPALLGWLAVMGTWFLVRALPVEVWPWVASGWLLAGAIQVAVIVRQRFSGAARAPYGTMGQRTMVAGFLALLVPFAPWWGWPVLGLGLWLTGPSWGAVLALLPGLLWIAPRAWLTVAAGALLVAIPALCLVPIKGQRLIHWTPRGGSLDSVRGRVNVLRLAWRLKREPGWLGRGPDTMTRDMQRYQHSTKVYIGNISELHCDPLHLCWEYGAFGVATVLLAAYRIGAGLQWGDPWSSAAVIGAGLSLTTMPLRVAPLGLVIVAIWAHVAP